MNDGMWWTLGFCTGMAVVTFVWSMVDRYALKKKQRGGEK